jgi:cytochrome c5
MKKTWTFVAPVSLAIACTSLPRGATAANLAKAQSGAPAGGAAFKQECAACHGERGESAGQAPSILGEGALPELPRETDFNTEPAGADPELMRLRSQTRPAGAPSRDPFRTAEDLYRYVSKRMPMPAAKAGSLSPDEYWAIINFMLLAHGVSVPPGGVNASNAGSVKL